MVSHTPKKSLSKLHPTLNDKIPLYRVGHMCDKNATTVASSEETDGTDIRSVRSLYTGVLFCRACGGRRGFVAYAYRTSA